MSMSDPVTRQECVLNHQTFNTRMDKLETKIEKVGTDVNKKVDDLTLELAKLPQALIEKLDERYADKETEQIVKRLMWLVISIVATALVYLVIKTN